MNVKKIKKDAARKYFNKGINIYMIPNRVKFDINGKWIQPFKFNNKLEIDFDKCVNNYAYYNCNNELGNTVAFYIEEV